MTDQPQAGVGLEASSADHGIGAGGRLFVMLLFLLSGMTGLVYEVTWVKILSLVFGSTIYSVSTILTTFFLGMGLGGYAMGRLADRFKRPFTVYCCLEMVVAVYAVAVPFIFDGVGAMYLALQRQLGQGSDVAGAIRLVTAFGVLVIPTFCMGATLPLLARVVLDRMDRVGRYVGGLYAINTWGAVAGCFLAGFVFLPTMGISLTLRSAAAVNFGIGLIGLIASKRLQPHPDLSADARVPNVPHVSDVPPETISPAVRALLWFSVFASGFTVLSLEVIWTRILVFFLRYTVYAFSTMLTAFLAGLAIGAVLASRMVDKRHRLVLWLGGLQLLVGALAIASIRVAGYLERANVYLLETFVPAGSEPSFFWNMTAKFLICFMVMLVPCVIMGMVFPSLLKIWIIKLGRVGRQTGSVYFVNTVGAMLGSLAAGFMIIPVLGLIGAPFAVAMANIVLGMLLVSWDTRGMGRAGGIAVAAALAGMTFVIVPPWTPSVHVLNLVPESRPEDDLQIDLVDIREGNTATVTVLEKRVRGPGREFKSRALGINGVVVAEGSQGTRTDRLNAYIPLLVHPDPQDVLVMGAAAGLTLDACQRFPVKQVDGVEIVPAVVEVMPLFAEYNGDVVNNPRVNIIVDDARNFLETTDKKYDVIINEAWLSVVTGSTPLYSREFFALVKSRLKPGGIFSLGPGKLDKYVEMTNSTVLTEFPYGYIWYIPEIDNVMTIATLEPLTFAGVRRRWTEPGVAVAMREVNLATPDQFLACLALGPEDVRELTGQGTVCTDDKPVYEYLQSAVYFLDVARQQPEDHDEKTFEEMVRRQPKVAHLMVDCGDPAGLIDRRTQTMQLMLRARLEYRHGDMESASALLRQARSLLSP